MIKRKLGEDYAAKLSASLEVKVAEVARKEVKGGRRKPREGRGEKGDRKPREPK